MRQTLLLTLILLLHLTVCKAQNVGIGTNSPNAKAVLEVKSIDKGILFPRLTSGQRNGISNPPNGLHVFNTDERCLNYYDSLFETWNCYCDGDTCHQITITVAPACGINFKTAYAASYTGAKKFVVLINAGDTICGNGVAALDFSTLTPPVSVKIINRGVIIGNGGGGGAGATGNTNSCIRTAGAGGTGGSAILTTFGVSITVRNYGFIAAGGGGGGGGGSTGADVYGGGGGGGAGIVNPSGGTGGGTTFSGPFGSCGTINSIAQNGTKGTNTTGSAGGTGANGGGDGGTGGNLGQQGQSGTGNSPGAGGAPGKAISGSTGNMITNVGGGVVIGAVD